jgi:hypothetical protein
MRDDSAVPRAPRFRALLGGHAVPGRLEVRHPRQDSARVVVLGSRR